MGSDGDIRAQDIQALEQFYRHHAMPAALGCDLAITAATPGSASQRNLQRYGSQILYTRPSLRRLAP